VNAKLKGKINGDNIGTNGRENSLRRTKAGSSSSEEIFKSFDDSFDD
jgi:hypothetical protein